ALQGDDRTALQGLAASADVRRLPPKTLLLLGSALGRVGLPEQAATLLRRAQRQYPGDQFINVVLGGLCSSYLRPPRYDEAARFWTAALAVRPHNPYLRIALGTVFSKQGAFSEAAAEFSKAVELKPDFADAHAALGVVLEQQNKWTAAEAAFREAIR